MTARTVCAYAKINFGLEVLGMRTDGFHEIRTVLATISLHDTLDFNDSVDGAESVVFKTSDPEVDDDQNLILTALAKIRQANISIEPQTVTVQKRIPAAAGLGGASSDAAVTLRAFAGELEAAGRDAAHIANEIGSDVPFFLKDHVALARGRGTELTSLAAPAADHWVVVVTPQLAIPNKTATMYSTVPTEWWSDGSAVESFAEQFSDRIHEVPPNVFERALLTMHPGLDTVRIEMIEAGCPFVALSGSGPSFYSIVSSQRQGASIASALRHGDWQVTLARLLGTAAQGE